MSWWARLPRPLARPLSRLAGAVALVVLLAACGAGPTGNPVGAPPLAPSTTQHPSPSRPTVHRSSRPPGTQPSSVPTTTPRPVHLGHSPGPRPKPPSLPSGTHSEVGNTPSGAPWEVPGTPERAAAEWVTGFFEVLWDQRGPEAWAGRVRPLTAPAYWQVLRRAATPPSPAEAEAWRKVVAKHELDQVDVLSAYRVDEAGYSATREVVLVDYDVSVRTQADPDAPPGPAQPAYLTMVRRGGRWLVAGFWAPLAGPSTPNPTAPSTSAKP